MTIRTELIYDRAALIDRSLRRLEKFAEFPLADFLRDSDNYAIAEHYLRISLEAIFDIGRHILVKSGLGKPGDYREILVLLNRNGIIPDDFFERVKGMAGYRNRLTHMYNEIDGAELYAILRDRRQDIKELTALLLKYVKEANRIP